MISDQIKLRFHDRAKSRDVGSTLASSRPCGLLDQLLVELLFIHDLAEQQPSSDR